MSNVTEAAAMRQALEHARKVYQAEAKHVAKVLRLAMIYKPYELEAAQESYRNAFAVVKHITEICNELQAE